MYPPASIELPENFLPEHPFDNGEMNVRDEGLAPRPRTPEDTRRQIGEYYAMITHVDAQIGRVLKALEASGRAGNTIIVFAGDNGLAVGRHGLMGKQSLYDHSVRVPLVMCGPGVPKGARRNAFCYLIDIFPTLCDLSGLDAPETAEGLSLLPAMRHADERIRGSLLYAYRHLHRGVRIGDAKLIEYVVDGERTTQLFDLATDPLEMENLAEQPGSAGRVAELRRELRRWRDEFDDPCSEFWSALDAAG
jgi:arylsulfatase A-like enzyme